MNRIDLPAHIRRFLAEFTSIEEEANELTSGFTNEAFVWRPSPDRWSVGECIEHLNVAGFLLLPQLRAAIDQAHARGVTGSAPKESTSPRFTLLERLFIRSMSPEVKIRLRTPGAYRPIAELEVEATVERFCGLQQELRRVATDAASLDLRRVRVTSPANRFLRMGLGAWLESTAVHERRHLLQAQKVRSHERFPRTRIEDPADT